MASKTENVRFFAITVKMFSRFFVAKTTKYALIQKLFRKKPTVKNIHRSQTYDNSTPVCTVYFLRNFYSLISYQKSKDCGA